MGQRTHLRLGVVRFTQPAAAGFYPIWFSNTLTDPIGDLSRAVAEELNGSGRFADVIYLGGPPLDRCGPGLLPGCLPARRHPRRGRDEIQRDGGRRALEPHPAVHRALAASLHRPADGTQPRQRRAARNPQAPGVGRRGGRLALSEQRLSWHEHNWYSVQSIPANERAVQTHALDHFVTTLAATLVREFTPARVDALAPRTAAASPGAP